MYSAVVKSNVPTYCVFQALCDQQLFDKAEENFKKAIELEPGNGNTYVHRGSVNHIYQEFVFFGV